MKRELRFAPINGHRQQNNNAIITAAGSNTPTTKAKISNAFLLMVGRHCAC